MRYAQFVIGPAGSGKSTYCSALVQHGIDTKRTIEVVNLDPAAEFFDYVPMADIRELIHVQDAMEDEELHFGPNGGLIFCMDYLVENAEWLRDKLGDTDDDYILFDCPGQLELYTYLQSMKKLVQKLKDWDFHVCSVFLVDCQFMTDGAKFLSGTMAAMTVMINMEIPHVNLLSKMDLMSKKTKRKLGRFLEPSAHSIMGDLEQSGLTAFNEKYHKLTEAIAELIEDNSFVQFLPLNLKDEENFASILACIDNVIQYGEDQDVRIKEFEDVDDDNDD